jgi:hypothetical protein
MHKLVFEVRARRGFVRNSAEPGEAFVAKVSLYWVYADYNDVHSEIKLKAVN